MHIKPLWKMTQDVSGTGSKRASPPRQDAGPQMHGRRPTFGPRYDSSVCFCRIRMEMSTFVVVFFD